MIMQIAKKGCVMALCCAVCIVSVCSESFGAAKKGQPVVVEGPVVRLKDSIGAAMQRNHALKSIQENRVAVEHELERAKAGWGPRVDLVGRAGINQLSDSTTRSLGTDKGFYGAANYSATITQPVWDGFATRSRVRTSQATLDSMTSRVYDNATTLALDAIIAHIDVIRLRKILALSEANVARHRELLVSSRDRERMGADTMADVSQAEGRLARALSSLEDARTRLLQGEATYRRLTGLSPSANLEPVVGPEPMFASAEEVLLSAEQHNPKLEAYKSDILAARGEKELAESAFHPTVNIEAGPTASTRAGKGEQWTSGVEIMGVVRWNIFNSGADMEATRAASARERQARQSLYDLMDTIMLDVKSTWDDYTNAHAQYKHYTDAVGYNTRTRDAYLEQFFLGNRTLLDVLDAESELYNSSTQATTAAGNILVGAYRLYGLTGTLLQNVGVEKAPLMTAPDAGTPAPVMSFK